MAVTGIKQPEIKWNPGSIESNLVPDKSIMMDKGITNLAYAVGDSIKNNFNEIQKYKKEYLSLCKKIYLVKDNLNAYCDTAYKCQYLREVYEKAKNIGSAVDKK